MKSSANRIFAFAAACLLTAGLQAFDSEAWLKARDAASEEASEMRRAYAEYSGRVNIPAENLTVPLESFPNGSVKSSIFAKNACFFLQEGYIWGKGVTIRQFTPDGKVESQVDADTCLVNRETRKAWVEGHAKAYYRNQAEIEGDNVFINATNEYITIYDNTVMEAEGRTLKGRRLDYDRKNGLAMLDGDVVLTGQERGKPYRLDGNKVFAFFQNTNELKRVVAYDGVKVKSENRSGSADKAVYLRAPNKVTLYAGETGRAHLEEKGSRNNSVDGSRITFWLDAEQVEVVDSEITAETKDVKKYGGFDGK